MNEGNHNPVTGSTAVVEASQQSTFTVYDVAVEDYLDGIEQHEWDGFDYEMGDPGANSNHHGGDGNDCNG